MSKIKTILVSSIAGIMLFAGSAFAVAPADYGLHEGDVIRATNDLDIYIVNDFGYKRLFTNPQIFNVYGHLGWDKVKSVSPTTRDAFVTSGLFRVDGTQQVYGLEVQGEDGAVLHWINLTGAQAVAQDPDFFKKVFVINPAEKALYTMGSDYTSLSQVPNYSRGETTPPVVTSGAVLLPLTGGTVTSNAQGLKVLSVQFNGNGAVDSLNVKKQGIFSSVSNTVYLVKDGVRITDPESFDSNGLAKFTNLGLTAPFTMDVVANLDSGGGEVVKVQLQGSYTGLPLTGPSFTTASVADSDVVLSVGNDDTSAFVGQANVKVGHFKFQAPTDEGITLKQLYVQNTGNNSIANPRLVIDGVSYSGTFVSDNKIKFDVNASAKKAKAVTAYLYVDVKSSANDMPGLKFQINHSYDITVMGDVFGFGLPVTIPTDVLDRTISIASLGTNGTLTASSVTGDPTVALWEDTGIQLFQFKLKAKDESFSLNDIHFTGLNDTLVKRLYVYDGSTLVGSEDVDGTVATVSSDYVLTGEKTFKVMADFATQDTVSSGSFTPVLSVVKATGTGSDEDTILNTSVTGKPVYVYASYPEFFNKSETDNQAYIALVESSVLKFDVSAVGGDLQFASTSQPFVFDIVENAVLPFTWRLEIDGIEVASGPQSSLSSYVLSDDYDDNYKLSDGQTMTVELFATLKPQNNNPIFRAELKDVAGNVKWQMTDTDGNYENYTSNVVKTLPGLPVKGPNFINL